MFETKSLEISFRFDAKLLWFGLVSFRVVNIVSFQNPSDFVSLSVRNETVKGWTHCV